MPLKYHRTAHFRRRRQSLLRHRAGFPLIFKFLRLHAARRHADYYCIIELYALATQTPQRLLHALIDARARFFSKRSPSSPLSSPIAASLPLHIKRADTMRADSC